MATRFPIGLTPRHLARQVSSNVDNFTKRFTGLLPAVAILPPHYARKRAMKWAAGILGVMLYLIWPYHTFVDLFHAQ